MSLIYSWMLTVENSDSRTNKHVCMLGRGNGGRTEGFWPVETASPTLDSCPEKRFFLILVRQLESPR